MEVLNYWPVLALAVAISVDGFSVGVTYGLRGIKVGPVPLLIISGISTIAIYLTSTIGAWIAELISKGPAEIIGSIILMAIGGWLVYTAYLNFNERNELSGEKLLFSLRIKPLGIIINVLKEPVKADLDSSGTINNSEAFILGLALALDAMGAGLGAGLSGFVNVFIPLLIGAVNLFFVCSGFFIGRKVGDILPNRFEILPGLIIITLGVIQLF
ncbi:MAG: hypothetical protein PWR10_1601 [Halanaerobiales bacterium]|nr:hypothetical protein [Halanaerobiales bacterium]